MPIIIALAIEDNVDCCTRYTPVPSTIYFVLPCATITEKWALSIDAERERGAFMCFIYDGCGHHATMRQTLKANNIPLVFFLSKDLHVTSACCVAYFSIQYVRLLCSYRRGRGARIERHAKAGFYSRMLRRFYWLPNCETLLRCGWTGLFLLEGRGENSATPWSYADYVTCWWNADFFFFFPYGTIHAKNDRINRFCF